MAIKGSREWFRQVVEEWSHYVADHATLREYAAKGEPYLKRLRRDLNQWWGAHPDPALRQTAEEIEALAQRLADYLHSYTSPITPPETYADILPALLASASEVSPDSRMSRISPMHPLPKRTSISEDTGEEDR